MTRPADRLDRLPAYVFAVIGDRLRAMQAAGIDVIRLDIGSPDAPPPNIVIERLAQAAHDPNMHGYSGYRGHPAFRQAVARYYQRRFGVSINPDTEVLPLLGSKEGIVNLTLAYCDTGDAVLIPSVGYPSYMQSARLAGADIEWVPVDVENGYLADFNRVGDSAAKRAKILWLNYPNNPTGAVASIDYLRDAVAWSASHDVLLAFDNPYCEVTFDGYVAPSILQVDGAKDTTVEFISLSKSHNMAGWRLGAAVGSKHAIDTLLKVKSNFDSGHFNAIYLAGQTALDDTPQSWIDARNHTYQARRDKLIAALSHIGLRGETPKASLYVWATPEKLSAADYVERALTEAHVSLAGGAAYGPDGTNWIRFSVGVPDDQFESAIRRLKAWYSANYG